MRIRLTVASLACLTSLAGCWDEEDIYDEVPLEIGTRFRLASTIEVPPALPGAVASPVDAVRELRAEPALALFALAARAEVPAADSLYGALPDALVARLGPAIDAHVDGVLRDRPAAAAALALAITTADSALGQIVLTSELNAAGGSAQHRLLTLGVPVNGRIVSFEVAGPLATAVTSAGPSYRSETSASLQLGAQSFRLPVGRYALQAIDAELERQAGGDLRTVLGAAVDCAGLATAVAAECVDGACIGHRDDLLAVCEGAVDRVVDDIAGTDAPSAVLRFAESTGYVTDGDGDGIGEQLAGAGPAQIDLGAGPRAAQLRFSTAPASP